jgi:hypothetical protein
VLWEDAPLYIADKRVNSGLERRSAAGNTDWEGWFSLLLCQQGHGDHHDEAEAEVIAAAKAAAGCGQSHTPVAVWRRELITSHHQVGIWP